MRFPMPRSLSLLAVICLAVRCYGAGLEKQPSSEYHARRVTLAAKLNGGAALIFSADEPAMNYLSWRQDEDFYYLTGWNESGAALLVEAAVEAPKPDAEEGSSQPAAPEPYREILFLRAPNPRLEVYKGVGIYATTPDVAKLAGVDEVRPMTDLQAELVRLVLPTGPKTGSQRASKLAVTSDEPKAKALLDLVGSTIGTRLTDARDLRQITAELRVTKSRAEIALLRKAAEASVAAHRAVLKAVEPGVSERSISGLIDYRLKEYGCERPSYPSIVGSGANAAVLHYMADENTMEAGGLVVVDAAGEYSMYASDITRTLPVNGHFTPRQREIYDIVLGAQRAAIAAFVSGKSFMGGTEKKDPNSLNKVAYDYVNTHGKDLHGAPLGKYWLHGLGHSVGIDVHDPFDVNKPFGPGAVFTIEPGIYIPEEKIGVRIEDTFYVDPEGKLTNLTGALPHTADEVEAAMKH
ncbi:MAG: aminopeptidase P N-terminal domain-containing protein [Bryobacteraceae bacterium]